MKKEFQLTFVVMRGTIFEVRYYTLGGNDAPHFATSAALFNKPRTDFNQCGQAQNELLHSAGTYAYNFYRRWDHLHLHDLTDQQYIKIMQDIEKLKKQYPFYIQTEGEDIRFSQQVELEREYRNKK